MAARASAVDRQLVAHQRAAAPRQDRWALGETCPVLLAAAGRGSSDPTPLRRSDLNDLRADRILARGLNRGLRYSAFSEVETRNLLAFGCYEAHTRPFD